MNERIKTLTEQAGIKEELVVLFKGDKRAYVLRYEDVEKFAELIVRECAKCCDTYSNDILKFSQFGSNAAQDCSVIIKEHFGVKDD